MREFHSRFRGSILGNTAPLSVKRRRTSARRRKRSTAHRRTRCASCATNSKKWKRRIIISNCSATRSSLRHNRRTKRTGSTTSRAKRRFLIGSYHNATCAISKRWDDSIEPITRSRSRNSRRSSARKFIRCLPLNRKPNENETTKNFQQNHSSGRAGEFARHGFVLKRADGEEG